MRQLKLRSWCRVVFCKKGVVENFTKFTGKHLSWSFPQACNLKKKETPAQVFSCDFFRWLLLKVQVVKLLLK